MGMVQLPGMHECMMPSCGVSLDCQASGCRMGAAHIVADRVIELGVARQVGEHHREELRGKRVCWSVHLALLAAEGQKTGSHATQIAQLQRLPAQ